MIMSLFQFPKTKHVRKLSPRKFKNYRTYKRYLQAEFSRVCVYCRQPDSSAPNLNFSVDHYRPKSIARFSGLINDYANLYYCCGSCNSRKNDYWPLDESKGPHVVSPCEFAMADHIRFNSTTGVFDFRSKHGEHTIELLQLNDQSLINWRKQTLFLTNKINSDIVVEKKFIVELNDLLTKKKITQQQYDNELKRAEDNIEMLKNSVNSLTGQTPLPPLRKIRLGVKLI